MQTYSKSCHHEVSSNLLAHNLLKDYINLSESAKIFNVDYTASTTEFFQFYVGAEKHIYL